MTTGACGALLIGVYLAAVRTVPGQRFEDSVLSAAAFHQDSIAASWAIPVLNTVTVFSLAAVVAAVVVIARLRRLPLLGWLAAGVVVASVLSGQLARVVLERPALLEFGFRRGDQSFPSGHTTVALSVLCAVGLVVPRGWRPLAIGLCSMWATSVTVGTVAAGWHRPSDTLGSGLIVLFWISLALAGLAWRGPLTAVPAPRESRVAARRPWAMAQAGVPILVVTSVLATAGFDVASWSTSARRRLRSVVRQRRCRCRGTGPAPQINLLAPAAARTADSENPC
jgi:membrane-associated phospholipid phosphatase